MGFLKFGGRKGVLLPSSTIKKFGREVKHEIGRTKAAGELLEERGRRSMAFSIYEKHDRNKRVEEARARLAKFKKKPVSEVKKPYKVEKSIKYFKL